MSKIAIFASGNGSNAEQIIRFINRKPQNSIHVAEVLSNRADAGVLQRAKELNVPTKLFTNAQFQAGVEILDYLKSRDIDWIVLAGFLRKIPEVIIAQYENRIFNVHPSLLPKYGGAGMYGMNVHKAVIENQEKESGISIHLINENFDEGEIIFQASCEVSAEDTAEDLAKKVQTLEHNFLPQVIEDYITKTTTGI